MIERDYNCIRDSVYFDSEWYRRTYNLGDDVDCADHYLNIGFKKNYDPSPNFSTIGYYQQHLTVKEWGMNPLLHYELYGK
jgi:hypothetical protein